MSPSTAFRSFKNSGMNKASDGGIPEEGFPHEFNSTYPSNKVDSDIAEDAPFNEKFVMKIPTEIQPLGFVDLGPVSRGGKE